MLANAMVRSAPTLARKRPRNRPQHRQRTRPGKAERKGAERKVPDDACVVRAWLRDTKSSRIVAPPSQRRAWVTAG